MIFDLFINACILITFISIAFLCLKDMDISLRDSQISKVSAGVITGSLGIILIFKSVSVGPDIIVDFRYIPLLIASVYIGWIPTIIASLMIGAFRVLYFGVSEPAIVAMVATVFIGAGFCIIGNLKSSRKSKWINSLIYLLMVSLISFLIISKSTYMFFNIASIYFTSNIVVAGLIFIYTEYLFECVRLYKGFKNESTKDFLTGLNNLRQFNKSFDNISQVALSKGKKLSLLFIDIDFFKNINDTYGHTAGDNVLKSLGKILLDSFEIFDVVSRNGGEEFSVLLIDCSSFQAVKIADKIRKKVKANKISISDEIDINITVSIGVSTYPDTTFNIHKLLENADAAMYEAKRRGRDRVHLFEKDNCIKEVHC